MAYLTKAREISSRLSQFADARMRASAPVLERAAAFGRSSLYSLLLQAVREKEFELVYQPILSLRTNRIVGAETLLRWRREGELICASEFIEELEQSDLLETVAEWALREACQRAAWIHRSVQQDFRMAVNVAPQQWEHPHLVDSVYRALEESGCNPEMLDLEITERTCLNSCDHVLSAIRQFRDRGIVVTIDDFGTGHANYACLQRFPITHLKIDKYYSRHTKAHDKVLRPIVTAAHRAGIFCTAEGIETEAQLRLLESCGCDEAQGYYIARPMDFDALLVTIEEQAYSEAWREVCAS
jgi:EAL domain-containing protein (putative c-di-GMP-specific phosphodiesterase class I)